MHIPTGQGIKAKEIQIKDELPLVTSDLKKMNIFLKNLVDIPFNNLHSNENIYVTYTTLMKVLFI